ncbi:MAG: hypothetical protein OJF58_000352 [Enhydrobacter sp.]|nr:MAG: hypothetical protein OJF58_000352 [Enhydrobacter sp.]
MTQPCPPAANSSGAHALSDRGLPARSRCEPEARGTKIPRDDAQESRVIPSVSEGSFSIADAGLRSCCGTMTARPEFICVPAIATRFRFVG